MGILLVYEKMLLRKGTFARPCISKSSTNSILGLDLWCTCSWIWVSVVGVGLGFGLEKLLGG